MHIGSECDEVSIHLYRYYLCGRISIVFFSHNTQHIYLWSFHQIGVPKGSKQQSGMSGITRFPPTSSNLPEPSKAKTTTTTRRTKTIMSSAVVFAPEKSKNNEKETPGKNNSSGQSFIPRSNLKLPSQLKNSKDHYLSKIPPVSSQQLFRAIPAPQRLVVSTPGQRYASLLPTFHQNAGGESSSSHRKTRLSPGVPPSSSSRPSFLPTLRSSKERVDRRMAVFQLPTLTKVSAPRTIQPQPCSRREKAEIVTAARGDMLEVTQSVASSYFIEPSSGALETVSTSRYSKGEERASISHPHHTDHEPEASSSTNTASDSLPQMESKPSTTAVLSSSILLSSTLQTSPTGRTPSLDRVSTDHPLKSRQTSAPLSNTAFNSKIPPTGKSSSSPDSKEMQHDIIAESTANNDADEASEPPYIVEATSSNISCLEILQQELHETASDVTDSSSVLLIDDPTGHATIDEENTTLNSAVSMPPAAGSSSSKKMKDGEGGSSLAGNDTMTKRSHTEDGGSNARSLPNEEEFSVRKCGEMPNKKDASSSTKDPAGELDSDDTATETDEYSDDERTNPHADEVLLSNMEESDVLLEQVQNPDSPAGTLKARPSCLLENATHAAKNQLQSPTSSNNIWWCCFC